MLRLYSALLLTSHNFVILLLRTKRKGRNGIERFSKRRNAGMLWAFWFLLKLLEPSCVFDDIFLLCVRLTIRLANFYRVPFRVFPYFSSRSKSWGMTTYGSLNRKLINMNSTSSVNRVAQAPRTVYEKCEFYALVSQDHAEHGTVPLGCNQVGSWVIPR